MNIFLENLSLPVDHNLFYQNLLISIF